MKHLKMFLLFFIGLTIKLYAQESYTINHKAGFMLPSAESIAKIKKVARPANLYTGIPDIGVQLWNGEFSIGLSYFAGGIQVNEESGSVGLGWNLETGGIIARIVYGFPDELLDTGYLNLSPQTKNLYDKDISTYVNTENEELNKIGDSYDPSPDIFYYSFNGISGKFVFDQNGNVKSIPKNNIKILPEINDITGNIDRFIIITPDGIRYIFSATEKILINNSTRHIGYGLYTSAWYLSSIRSVDQEYVAYEYNPVHHIENRRIYEYGYYDESGNLINGTVTSELKITRPQLVKITGSNSIANLSYGYDNELLNINISGIIASNFVSDFELIESIAFNYGEFPVDMMHDTSKRKLGSVDIGKSVKKKYSFTYKDIPINSNDFDKQDLWGYYNENVTTMLPEMVYGSGEYEYLGISPVNVNISGSNRSVNEETIQRGMLSKIENPQGGVTEYIFEPQSFIYNGQTILGGGLRIDTIKSYDPKSVFPLEYTNYEYISIDDGQLSGSLLHKPKIAYDLGYNPSYTDIDKQTFRRVYYSYGLSLPYGNSVYYQQVTVSKKGLGKIVKDFELPIEYQTEQNDFSSELNLENILTDSEYISSILFEGKNYSEVFCYDWNNVYLSQTRTYDANDNLLNKSVYNYTSHENAETIYGFRVSPGMQYTNSENRSLSKNIKSLYKYYYPSSWKMLSSKDWYDYANGAEISHSISYIYDEADSEYRFPIETNRIDADGYARFRKNIYPYHYIDDNTELDNEIQTYYDELLALDQQQYRDVVGDTYTLNKSVSNLPSEPKVIASSEENYTALKSLKIRGEVSSPVEIIEGITVDGGKKILNSSLFLYKINDNQAIVKDKELYLNGPVDYLEEEISKFNSETFEYSLLYKLSKKYTYDEVGQLIKTINADGSTEEYSWYKYGDYLSSETLNSTHTVRFKYNSYGGVTEKQGLSGNKVYYIYDTDGNIVAKKDQDKNIRELYQYNLVNTEGEQEIDTNTDPDNTFAKSTEPIAQLDVYQQTDGYYVNAEITNFNEVFDYTVDFGDGSNVESIENNTHTHVYPAEGDYTVTLKESKFDVVYNEKSANVSVTFHPLEVTYAYYDNGVQVDEINGAEGIEGAKVYITPTQGRGPYTVSWNVINETNSSYSFTQNDSIIGMGISFINIVHEGTYQLNCQISDGYEIIQKNWSFSVAKPIRPE